MYRRSVRGGFIEWTKVTSDRSKLKVIEWVPVVPGLLGQYAYTYISYVYVTPHTRRRGIATKLLSKLVAETKGVILVLLYRDSSRVNRGFVLKPLLRRLGFRSLRAMNRRINTNEFYYMVRR